MPLKQNKKEQVLIGKILGAHGIKGYVRLKLFMDNPLNITEYETLYDEETGEPYIIKPLHTKKDILVASIEGIKDRTTAEALKGTNLVVAREALRETTEDVFYQHTLIGMAVIVEGKVIGQVVAIENHGAGDLLYIEQGAGPSFLFPFRKEFVIAINENDKKIVLDPDYFRSFIETLF